MTSSDWVGQATVGFKAASSASNPAGEARLATQDRFTTAPQYVSDRCSTISIMSENPDDVDDATSTAAETLLATTYPLDGMASKLPSTAGVYSWWADSSVFPTFTDHTLAQDSNVRLLYLGLASNLRKRVTQNHLRRSGSSTLRRTLAGLLIDTENYRTRLTDRVVLIDDDEIRLTEWMTTHLRLSWVEHPRPELIEAALIKRLRPPLNVNHADGPAREIIESARRRYRASVDTP